MAIDQYTFEDFIQQSGHGNEDFYKEIHEFLMEKGYKTKIELKKTGFALSYIEAKSKKVIMNYVTRKKGIFLRVYGDHADEYAQIFQGLPESMTKEIKKAQDCKRFLDDKACNSRCKKGIKLFMDGKDYGKCRYSALFFFVEDEKYDAMKKMIQEEVSCRS